MGWGSHRGTHEDQQGVRARVRAAGKALEGDDGHTIAPLYIEVTGKTKAMYVTSLRRLQALAPNFQPSLVMSLSADVLWTQRDSFIIIRHVDTSLLFNIVFYYIPTF